MSSTCFESVGSSSGRRLYVQVWYNSFPCSLERLLIPLACKQIIPHLQLKPSSWRWVLGFETCRRHCKN